MHGNHTPSTRKFRGIAAGAFFVSAAFLAAANAAQTPPAGETSHATSEAIRRETLLPPRGEAGRPLPLAATWAPLAHNFSPDYQLDLIERGRHLLLCYNHPWPDTHWGAHNQKMRDDNFAKYYAPSLAGAARLKLPISFQRFQFEMELTTDKAFFDLPPEQNPNVIGLDGKIRRQVDPLGPIEHWRALGRQHTTSECMRRIQEAYPDPPRIFFLSNNEHAVLAWHEAETSKRYLDRYGKGRDAVFRQTLFAEELTKRYRALQEGMREGLVNDVWKRNARFIAYEAFGPPHLGRFGGWHGSAGFSPQTGRLLWHHKGWDGGSPSYYLHDWCGFLSDHTSSSMQVEAMNWPFMLDQALEESPDFWFELSTWDGDTAGINGKRGQFAGRGQIYHADRYQGLLQFGLWLLRPRALRDYRYQESLAYAEPYYLANVKAVEQVHASPLLQRFWRHGRLVANPARKHPYQAALTPAVEEKTRWFLLKTDLEPATDSKAWGLYTELPVMPLALVLGEAPEREWLLYLHAPQGARTGVTVTVPDYGEVVVDASVTGSFYHLRERGRQMTCVIPGGPPSAEPIASDLRPAVGAEVAFSAANRFAPGAAPATLSWDFGDGKRATGATARHAFAERGQFVVTLTLTDASGTSSTRYLPISVGYPQWDDCLLYLPLEKMPERGVATEKVTGGGYTREPGFIRLVHAANTLDFCGLMVGGEWSQDAQRGWTLRLRGGEDCVAVHGFYGIEWNRQIPRYDALGRNRTTSLWFKADDTQSRQVIYQDGSSNDEGLNLYLDAGKLYAGAWSGKVKDWQGTWLSTPVTPGTWHHVALVLDGAEPDKLGDCLRLYLDGREVAAGQVPLLRPNWARIGGGWSTRYHDGTVAERNASAKGSIALDGWVDDFAVFLKPLSETELRRVMAAEEP